MAGYSAYAFPPAGAPIASLVEHLAAAQRAEAEMVTFLREALESPGRRLATMKRPAPIRQTVN